MKTKFAVLTLTAALLACTASLSAHAGFNGTGFSTYYALPNLSTVYAGAAATLPSFNVGAGIETIFDVEGVTTITVDFDDTALSLLFNTTLINPTWNTAAFNGLVFDLTSGGSLPFSVADITGVATDMAGFTTAQVALTGNRISFNWSGLPYTDGTQIVVNFTPAIPEPGTYALMALGLAVVAGVARKRSESKVAH